MRTLEFDIENLEDRRMLAVNIAFNANSGVLRLTGDNAVDVVQLDGNQVMGSMTAYVNGTATDSFVGVNRIIATMRGGDDELHLNAINIGGGLNVNMGAGADFFTVDNAVFDLPPGGNVLIGGPVMVNMGNNAGDFTQILTTGHDITFGNRVTITGAADVELDGTGNDHTLAEEEVSVLGNLTIRINGQGNVGGFSSEILLNDVNVGGRTNIRGSNNADDVLFDDNTFAGRINVNLGGGDDTLRLDNQSFYTGKVTFNGGAGTDTLVANVAEAFVFAPTVNSFEV